MGEFMASLDRFAKALPAGSLLLAAALLVSCGSGEGDLAPAAPDAAAPAETVAPATGTDGQTAGEPATDIEPAPAEPNPVDPAPGEPTPADPGKGAAQPASAAGPAYIGTWGVDLAQCAVAQEYEQPPMILRADGYDQHEAHCEFDSVTETGPSQWRVSGLCSVEGDEQPIDYNLAVIDGNLVHWADGGRKDAWTLVRCPE